MSYAATASKAPDNSTDAAFRLWGSAISDALASMGLIQTADTGQINWTTVTRPTSTNTSQGYEIWRFDDSLQGTSPVFFKIEFGGGAAASGGNPSLWLTIGSSSNGTGTITGQVNTRVQLANGNVSSASSFNMVFSGDTGRVGVAIFTNFTNGAIAFFIERTKNTDGTDSALGVLYTSFSGSATRFIQYIPASGSVPASITDTNIQPPIGVTGGAYGSDLALYPNLHNHGGSYLNAGLALLGYFNADISRDVTFTMTLYGATHTLYPLGNTASLSTAGRGNSPASLCIAMRYE